MSHTGTFDSHILSFARSQVQMIAKHLESEEVDFAFVARHAQTLVQIAEGAQDPTDAFRGYGSGTKA